jgi:protein-disulfide isomerase
MDEIDSTLNNLKKEHEEATKKNDVLKTHSKSEKKKWLPIAIAIIFIMFIYFGTRDTAPNKITTRVLRSNIVNEDDDPFKGSDTAKVTIIEFSDFQCPFCKEAENTLKEIEKEYGDKLRIVYRDFPLDFHANAMVAAMAAECAHDQDKFWQYHDRLFEVSTPDGSMLDAGSLKKYAVELGLNSGEFNNCLDSGKHKNEILSDIKDGKRYGVTGTPAFFINGKKLSGAQPFAAFKKLIDGQLE